MTGRLGGASPHNDAVGMEEKEGEVTVRWAPEGGEGMGRWCRGGGWDGRRQGLG